MENVLVNRVAESGIITINLEDNYPSKAMLVFDIKDYLFHRLILKEKDFRDALKVHDWTQYQDKITLIVCTADAIIPLWAYMLVTQHLSEIAADIFVGSEAEYLNAYYNDVIKSMPVSQYKDQRIVIKGCSNKPVPAAAYAYMTQALRPYALSIMFGEPCSTVPVYKRPKAV
jgi:hypothetical protein